MPEPGTQLPDRLRAGLRQAMVDGDTVAVRTLRTALGALANAEAVPLDQVPREGLEPVVGQLVDHPRRELSEIQCEAILREEIADRQDTIRLYLRAGRHEPADQLQREVDVLAAYL